MTKKSRFRGPLDKQHVKHAQALLKSTSQHLYDIHWSLPIQLNWRKSLLLTSEILGRLVTTLTVNEKYPVFNRDNSTIPIQMEISQKQEKFCKFFFCFLKICIKFWIFWTKRWPSELLYLRNYQFQKRSLINV